MTAVWDEYRLDDRYDRDAGRVFMTSIQALARIVPASNSGWIASPATPRRPSCRVTPARPSAVSTWKCHGCCGAIRTSPSSTVRESTRSWQRPP
jgi:hypothetical protein